MNLKEIQKMLNAELVCGGEWLGREVACACGADLMSDVLAFTKERTLLLTGMTNIQVVRTAEMSDCVGIVFVRGKKPGQDVIDLAMENKLPLFITSFPMYEACGVLYKNGLCGCARVVLSHGG